MKRNLKWVLVLTGTVLLLCSCSHQAKYEPLDISEVVEDEPETEAETEEVIHLVPLPPEVFVRVPVNLLKAPGKTELGAYVERGIRLKVTGSEGEDSEGNVKYYIRSSDYQQQGATGNTTRASDPAQVDRAMSYYSKLQSEKHSRAGHIFWYYNRLSCRGK